VTLLDIRRLRETYGPRVAAIGFSGHHLGIALDVVAYALGATWIERHFTLDRTWKGTDQAASIEPQGLSRLVRDIEAVALAWREKPTAMQTIEREQREKLKYRGTSA
jgi:N-acetylneuraminate synthase